MNVGGSSMRVILIKYGELSTKKGNRNFFINTLYNNVKSKLGMYDVSINKDRAKMTIKFRDEDLDDIVKIVGKVFGIHTFNIAYLCDSDEDAIKSTAMEVVSNTNFNTFKLGSVKLIRLLHKKIIVY